MMHPGMGRLHNLRQLVKNLAVSPPTANSTLSHGLLMDCRACYRAVVLCLLQLCFVTADPVPLWKSLLIHHPEWQGFYLHDGGNYNCYIKVIGVGLKAPATTYVTFNSEHSTVDMNVWSDGDTEVLFHETNTWDKHSHFVGHTNLMFTGLMLPYHGYHRFVGNVSSDEMVNFGTIMFRPSGALVPPPHKDDSSLKYGLAVGIPVTLAVLLIAAGAVILWWAIKKGYLRHIPLAYKNFTNPKTVDSTSEPTHSDHEMVTTEYFEIEQPGSVHI